MITLFVHPLFNQRFIQPLCWTLIHSLWQGLLLTIVTGFVILLTRRSGPVIRYGLFSALFFLFVLGVGITFGRQWVAAASRVNTEALIVAPDHPSPGVSDVPAVGGVAHVPVEQSFSGRLTAFSEQMGNYFNAHASLIVTLWFIIFSAQLVRIMAQLGAVQRLRHYRTHAPAEYWKDRLQELARLLQISVPVTLLESEIVKAPMMAGFFKPVILLPLSILSQLPPEQVEAVLLHELAHIRRRDYFVNLIQRFAEVLFFFNPGVLWISALMREERENCCDDMAIRQVGSKKEFINALVSFQAYGSAVTRSAVAFPGSGNHLLQRVQRIVYQDNKTLDGREKFFLLCCFLIGGGLMLAFTHPSAVERPFRAKVHAQVYAPVPIFSGVPVFSAFIAGPAGNNQSGRVHGAVNFQRDCLPDNPAGRRMKGNEGIMRTGDTVAYFGKGYQIVTRDNKVMSVYYQGEKMSDEQIAANDEQIREIIKQELLLVSKRKIEAETGKIDIDGQDAAIRANRERVDAEGQRLNDSTMIAAAALDAVGAERAREDDSMHVRAVRKDRTIHGPVSPRFGGEISSMRVAALEDQQKKLVIELANLEKHQEEVSAELTSVGKLREDIADQQRFIALPKGDLEESNTPASPGKPAIPRKAARPTTPIMPSRSPVIDRILADLVHGHLADGHSKTLSFTLNKDELIVNGVQQPDEVYQRFKEKYIKDPRNQMIYSRKDGSESNTVSEFQQ